MIDKGSLPPDVRAVLDQERPIPPLPPAVRSRAIAAARAAIAAGAVPPPASLPHPWIRWAAVATLTAAAGVAVGAIAYRRHAQASRPVTEPAPAAIATLPPAPSPVARPAPSEAIPPAPPAEDAKRTKQVVPQEELRLLRQARAAVASEDFAAALPPIAEHTRRFRDGRLAEEREALRVKALAGLGRKDEAHHAATAFASRFPRSVLLPAVRRISPDAP